MISLDENFPKGNQTSQLFFSQTENRQYWLLSVDPMSKKRNYW